MKNFIFSTTGIGLVAAVLLGSCQKQEQNVDQDHSFFQNETTFAYFTTDTNIVQYSEAIHLAQKLTMNYIKTNVPGLNNRPITNGYALDDKNGDPAVYVYNYTGGGYSIISADLRYQPLLAFVNTGSLNINDSIPSMLGEWIGYNVEQIQIIRENNNPTPQEIDDIEFNMFSWNTELQSFNVKHEFTYMKQYVPTPYPNCDPVFDQIGELMSTTWGQDATYNNLVPLNCPSRPSGKAPTGCVATAVAQLLKFHAKSHPLYNYSLMPDDIGNIHVQELMSALGTSSQLNMSYHCVNGSGAYSNRVPITLDNAFTYHNSGVMASYDGAKRWDIVSNIQANLPVYVDGCAVKTTSWFRTSYDKCHAWIADGYRINGTSCRKHVWFFKNWGWNGDYNGLYYHNNWKPKLDSDFQYNLGMIYNIVPEI